MARRPEETARDEYLAAIGALPGVVVYRSEVIVNLHHARSLPTGHPDVVLLLQGHVVLQEWKSAVGVQAKVQRAFQRSWEQAGGTYWVCRTLPQVLDLMIPLSTGETRARLLALSNPDPVPW